MDKTQLMFAICFITLLILLLAGFLLFVILWQRRRSNQFISERERMEMQFTEQLLTAQLEMQEQTFNMISMEIHDSVGQTLSLVKVHLNILDQKGLFDKQLLTEARNNVGQALTELRDIAKSLNTERITTTSLPEMVIHESERINNTGIISAKVKQHGPELPVSKEKKVILFRIIQECFQNIMKHAQADSVEVEFIFENDLLTISVKDNGKGFDTEATGNGLGIRNMRTRAAVIGGHAEINSKLGEGTTLLITTPYE